jgi:radical SAM/Cys-rich protein
MHATLPLLEKITFPSVVRKKTEILQVNLGYQCNLSCLHCHVNAGPTRKEMMEKPVIDALLSHIKESEVKLLDLTGGAPELNKHFSYLVESARGMGIEVIDRCNLTILEEVGQEMLATFLAKQEVKVVASLPCYMEDNVDEQRGSGVFNASIKGLKRLNALGYGMKGSALSLDLVFNPQGPTLPPAQEALEEIYKEHLFSQFGVVFNNLLTVTNMPINRFGSTLISKNRFDGYMTLLKSAYNAGNLDSLMCRDLISVDWQGYLYDCDFNQMLELPIKSENHERIHISQLSSLKLKGREVKTAGHCYGCSAGQGSSCGGALE